MTRNNIQAVDVPIHEIDLSTLDSLFNGVIDSVTAVLGELELIGIEPPCLDSIDFTI